MTRDECLGKGKTKKRGGRDGDGGEASRDRLGESQAQTDEDKQCWWTGRFGVLRGGGGGKTTRTGERRRGVWREKKPEAPREGRACTDR